MFHIDPDGPIMGGLTKLANLVLLNLWFVLCCLPVFTIGASFTALMDMTTRMVKGEEGSAITKGFFKAFKENFGKSTTIWLIQFILILLCGCDFFIGQRLVTSSGLQLVFYAIWAIATMLVLFTTWYALTLQAIFENRPLQTIKNGLLISVGRFPYSLLIGVLFLSPLSLVFMSLKQAIFIFPLVVMVWFAAAAYGAAFIFQKALKPFFPQEETGEDASVVAEGTFPEAGEEVEISGFAALDELEKKIEREKE